MNRGSAIPAGRAPVDLQGFNEAPIHESGKCSQAGQASLIGSGFNEAPIHESGKWRRHWPRFHRQGASMRPRFMNRGSDAPLLDPT